MKKFLLMVAAALTSTAAMAQLEAGKYFVKNNESGQFLSNGANWGTRSILFGRGIEYDVTVGEDGKYTLKSGIKNDNNALRPSDGFNDQSGAWELHEAEGGYYMYNGEKYFCNSENGIPGFKAEPDASCVWSFVTADERKAALAKATAENPVDATVFIQAADFHNADVKNSAWSKTKIGGDFGSGCTMLNSANCEQWNAGEFTISQTITGLPNGIYTVTCQGFTRKNGTTVESADSYENGEVLPAYLYAGEKQVALKSIFAEADTESKNGWSTVTATSGTQYVIANGQNTAAAKFSEGAYVNTIEGVIVTDGTLEIGVTSEGGIEWIVFDTFRLTYYGVPANSVYQEGLKDAVAAAEDLSDAVANAALKQAYADALTAATTAAENNGQSDEYYQEALSTLNSAKTAVLASIEVYKEIAKINEKAAQLKGADAADAYADVLATYNNGTATEVAPFEAAYNAAKAVATGGYQIEGIDNTWEGSTGGVPSWGCPSMPGAPERFAYAPFEGDVLTKTITGLKPGTYTVVLRGGASTTGNRDNFEVLTGQNRAFFFANDALQSMEVYSRTTIYDVETATLTCGVKEDGVLRMGIQNITKGANWFVINLESITYESAELPTKDVDLAVTDAKWATFIAPFDADLPTGVTAYTVDGVENDCVLVLNEQSSIKANTPVILFCETPVTETITGVSKAETAAYTVGLLTGVYAPVEITAGYVLQSHDSKVGFYKVTSAKTVPANKAYLEPVTSEVNAFYFDQETAIQAVEALAAGKAQIFDLQGRQQQKLQKGLNIVNGVKVLVK